MSENNELTLLLTLWDRVPFTFRWMEYANRIKLPFKVFIADGSADDSPSRALADQSNFPNVDYEYARYPHDSSQTDYYDKLVDGLAHVDTPFVALADNDDFYVVDGLLRSMEFLKANPDYSSCRGTIAGFKIAPDAEDGELRGVYGQNVSFVRQVYPDKPNAQETAVERTQNYCSSYRPNWYDVCRIEQARAKFKALRDLNTYDIILAQHVPMLLGVIAGKVDVQPYLYLVRQLEAPGSSDSGETQQKGDLFDRMLLETWSQDFQGFLDVIAGAIAEKDSIPLEDAHAVVKKAYRELMTAGIVRCLMESAPQGRAVQWERKLNSHLGPVAALLRDLYPSIQKMLGRRSVNGYEYFPARQLLDSDKDFKQIYDFLATSPSASKVSRQFQITDQPSV